MEASFVILMTTDCIQCGGGAVTAAVNHGCQDHIIAKQMRVSGLGTVHRYATLDKDSIRKASLAVFSS